MAHTVEEHRPMKARQLYDHLDRYASDNSYSNEVEDRWLSTKVEAFKATVAAVMNKRLEPSERDEVNAFLAAEIEKEVEKKRRELDALERDLRRVRPVKAVA